MSRRRATKRPAGASASSRFARLPVELLRRVADVATSSDALALHISTGRAAPLGHAFQAANELRRAAVYLRQEDDEGMFRRWEQLVVPLRCVVVAMELNQFIRVVSGAAKKGIEALSELDVSRLDLTHRKIRQLLSEKQMEKNLRRGVANGQGVDPAEVTDEQVQAAREALGDQRAPSWLFDQSIQAIAGFSHLRFRLGPASPAWSWMARNASSKLDFSSSGGPSEVYTAATQSMLDFLLGCDFEATPPGIGDPDIAAVYERRSRGVMAPCAAPRKFVCDGCLALKRKDRDLGRVAYSCAACKYALCADCAVAAGTMDHPCNPRMFEVSISKDDRMRTFIRDFHDDLSAAPNIAPGPRLAANLRLYQRIQAQREWLAGVESDREVARRKLAEGKRAHAAWLRETYSKNPFE